MYPIKVGATLPPKCPIIFIAADSVPTYRPPRSIAVVQEIGPLSSAAKVDRLIAPIAQYGSWIDVNSSSMADAPPYAMYASTRRVRTTLPFHRDIRGASHPQNRLPNPAASIGAPASSAPC